MASDTPQPINFGIDPLKVPVLFAENFVIASNENAVTFNFAQPLLDGTQQNIVARVAMTRERAKEFLKTLNDHIEKFEL